MSRLESMRRNLGTTEKGLRAAYLPKGEATLVRQRTTRVLEL